ncbi:MAG: hypothetical protein U0930_10825 [Pirellulales bacterium]
MNVLFENPVIVVLFGVAVGSLLAFAATKTGDRRFLIAAGAVAAIALVLGVIATTIETEKEKLTKTIYQVADAVRNNDHDRALTYMHPSASAAAQRAKTEISRFKFQDAKVTSIQEVVINDKTKPPSATTEFLARMSVEGDHTDYGVKFNGVRLIKVYWMKQGDRWLISDYEHSEAMSAFRK